MERLPHRYEVIRVPLATDRERARRTLDKAGRTCLVSASLATPIRLEPEIAREP
jgi:hypothetical protein